MVHRIFAPLLPILMITVLSGCDECARSTDCDPGQACQDGNCVGSVPPLFLDGGTLDLDVDTDTDTDTDTDADEDSGPVIVVPDDCLGPGLSWDSRTELCWADGRFEQAITLRTAVNYCDNLSHGGSDDWHLPKIQELRTLINGCPSRNCGISEPDCLSRDCAGSDCDACAEAQGPNPDGCYQSGIIEGPCLGILWSSTQETGTTYDNAFIVMFSDGNIIANTWTSTWNALCVRTVPAV